MQPPTSVLFAFVCSSQLAQKVKPSLAVTSFFDIWIIKFISRSFIFSKSNTLYQGKVRFFRKRHAMEAIFPVLYAVSALQGSYRAKVEKHKMTPKMVKAKKHQSSSQLEFPSPGHLHLRHLQLLGFLAKTRMMEFKGHMAGETCQKKR